MKYVGGSPMTEQEARSSVMEAAPPSAVKMEEEGTVRSVQRTASLPMIGTSFPANRH